MSDNLFFAIRQQVVAALCEAVPGLDAATLARVDVTPTREAGHGDMATNAAMVASKPAREKPSAIAGRLAAGLVGRGGIAAAEAAGPGFVNLTLSAETLLGVLPAILRRGEDYGASGVGDGVGVNVEYVSANPTGPLHIGHCRGAVVGDALCGLLAKAGYAVTREYYLNDAGAQVIALAWAAYWRYLQALGTSLSEAEFSAAVPGGLQYRGDYLVAVGQALAARHGDGLAQGLGIADPSRWLDVVRDFTIEANLAAIREDLATLGVRQDVVTSERALLASGAVQAAIDTLDGQGLIYQGVLEPPRGKTPEDWEAREQTLFRATRFGDDVDRPLRKSDGSNTYFANDIAYHADKAARGAAVLIDVLGADHGGYVPRMRAAVAALSGGAVSFEALICQIVHVVRDGQPVRMSKRAGSFVTLRDLLDEVGPDAVRFTMLMRKPDAQMEFDLALVVAQTRENPVFYVQYAHARCRSVLRAAGAAGIETAEAVLAEAPLGSLAAAEELAVVRRLVAWPRLIEGAALAREPHRVAFFLYELAGDFHMLWNRGRDESTLRFLQAERPVETRARLALVAAVAVVLRSGLAVLGVSPVEEMR